MAHAPIPQHVAIIMDGNGRWAAERSLPRLAGHRAGIQAVREAMTAARELGVRVLTLYTFSTENWSRPKREVSALFKLLEEYIDREKQELIRHGIRLVVIGRVSQLPQVLQQKLAAVMEATSHLHALTLVVALNYGGRAEITDAARALARDVARGALAVDAITEEHFRQHLYAPELPDPDLLIRTSGEMRISNFLLWQIAYTELYVTRKLWPDFKKADFKRAVQEYETRQRRFGG